MDPCTLLIADSDENFRRALFLALQGSFFIRTCGTGHQALALLRTCPAHILVADLMLPEMDGLTLAETLFRENIFPEVLLVAPEIPQNLNQQMEWLDIRYFLRKPCSTSAAVSLIRDLRQELISQGTLSRHTRQLLRQMRILPKYDGYSYLLYILPVLAENPELMITKHLYLDTAKAFGCTTRQVERSIRNALEKTWEIRPAIWDQYFPHHTKRPANGLFLQVIALELRKNLE